MNDSIKFLKLIQQNKENARKQRSSAQKSTPKIEEEEHIELTFNSGNILRIGRLKDLEAAQEILDCLKMEYENRMKAYWIKPNDKKRRVTLYIRYSDRFDAVFSMQILLETFGHKIKDDLTQMNVEDSEKVIQESFQSNKTQFVEVPTYSRFVDRSFSVVIKNVLLFDNHT